MSLARSVLRNGGHEIIKIAHYIVQATLSLDFVGLLLPLSRVRIIVAVKMRLKFVIKPLKDLILYYSIFRTKERTHAKS